MTTTLWVDAAYAATPAQVQAAIKDGVQGCGFYLPDETGNDDPLNQWSPSQVASVRNAGFGKNLVPVWVPKPSLPGNPVTEATAAFNAAKACGCSITMSGLYCGNHLETTGQITGPVWLPIPGAEPTTVGSQSAIQWGQSSVDGWSVDWDVAASNFPWNKVLMVDFEYNTVGGQAGINWYKAFQAQIAKLGAVNIVPKPAPTGGNPPVDHVSHPPVAILPALGGGYWIVCSDGGVFNFNAPFYGSLGGVKLAKPIIAAAASDTGKGYWMLGADGGVFEFGDAKYHGRVLYP